MKTKKLKHTKSKTRLINTEDTLGVVKGEGSGGMGQMGDGLPVREGMSHGDKT